MKQKAAMERVLLALAGAIMLLISACGSNSGPTDETAPAVPTDVKAVATSPTEILLSWTAASDNVGVTQYEIYVEGISLISMESTTTVFLYSGLTPSTEYCCTVRAIDAAGNESALSDPPACAVTGSFTDTSPPAAPSGLTGTCSQTKIALSWSAPSDGVRFSVYRDGVLTGAVSVPSFIDSGLAASTPYCYAVTAFDAAGNESLKSSPFCITTLAPPLDTSLPAVLSTSPANNAIDVQTDPLTLSAIFSEAMNTFTVFNAANFTLSGGVTGVLSYDNTNFKITFTPSTALASNTTYTVTIGGNVMDAAGNPMGADYVWSFTTAAAPAVTLPIVISTNPADNEAGVSLGAAITAVFSEPMALLTITNNPGSFTVNRGVQGLVAFDGTTKTATFTPTAPLSPATIYTCTISHTVTDTSGHQMAADYIWSFMTTTGL